MFIELIVSTYLFGFMNLIRPTDHSSRVCRPLQNVAHRNRACVSGMEECAWTKMAWVWGSLCAMKLKPFLKIIKWCWTFLVIIFNDLDCEYVNVLRYLGNTVQSHSCVSIISFFYVSTDVLSACYGKQVMSEKSTNTIESHVEKNMQKKGTERWEKMHEQTKA